MLALGQPQLGSLHEDHVDCCDYCSYDHLSRFPAGGRCDNDTTMELLDPQPHSRDHLRRSVPFYSSSSSCAAAALAAAALALAAASRRANNGVPPLDS